MSDGVRETIARSFERINYSVRPAKAAERHMMVEAFGRLTPFCPLAEYTYVGFGSTFFIDFKLLHQRYAMTRLWSIEIDEENSKRFLFNKPYDCIKMLFGPASSRLSDVEWGDRPAIVWLDYDYPLDEGVLSDIDRVVERVSSGSLLLVTAEADPGDLAGRAERLRKQLDLYAPPLKDEELHGWVIADHYFQVLAEAIPTAAERARGDELGFEQVFAFRYKDSARMATYGGILVSPDDREKLKECRFGDLGYVVRAGKKPFDVSVPNLTPREQAAIDNFMPTDVAAARKALAKQRVPRSDVDDYSVVYRYAPRFIETFA